MADFKSVKQQLAALTRQARVALKEAERAAKALGADAKRAEKALAAAQKAADKAAEMASSSGAKKDAKAADKALALVAQAKADLSAAKRRERALAAQLQRLRSEVKLAERAAQAVAPAPQTRSLASAPSGDEVHFQRSNGSPGCINPQLQLLSELLPHSMGGTGEPSVQLLGVDPSTQSVLTLSAFLDQAQDAAFFAAIAELPPADTEERALLLNRLDGILRSHPDFRLIALATGCGNTGNNRSNGST